MDDLTDIFGSPQVEDETEQGEPTEATTETSHQGVNESVSLKRDRVEESLEVNIV